MPNRSKQIEIKSWLVKRARELGFLDCRVAVARKLTDEAKKLEQWLEDNHHGQMNYMAAHFDKRIDPTLLVPGAKTVIVFTYNYYPEASLQSENYKISRYAYGKDYHKVIKNKLKILFSELRENYGQIEGRYFVDSAPILEHDWAKISGIGWTGKNTLTLTEGVGSYFFLAELIIDLELPPDSPVTERCGTCTRCIEACPTEAIDPSGTFLHAEKCISYLTIELKENIPSTYKDQLSDWIYGCDICQEVCPWNRFSSPTTEPKFKPNDHLQSMTDSDWENLTEKTFEAVFSGSAVKRAGFKKLKSTIDFVREK